MGRSNPELWEKSKEKAKAKMGGKHCTTCKEQKPLEEFTSNKSKSDGKMGYCKTCNNLRNKAYRKIEGNLEVSCKRVFGYLSRRVKAKNLKLNFSFEFLMELYIIQKGLCAYTNEPLELPAGSSNTLSVDRIDSSKGYTKDNVCLTTWKVNNCKQALSLFDFVDLCKRVVENAKDE